MMQAPAFGASTTGNRDSSLAISPPPTSKVGMLIILGTVVAFAILIGATFLFRQLPAARRGDGRASERHPFASEHWPEHWPGRGRGRAHGRHASRREGRSRVLCGHERDVPERGLSGPRREPGRTGRRARAPQTMGAALGSPVRHGTGANGGNAAGGGGGGGGGAYNGGSVGVGVGAGAPNGGSIAVVAPPQPPNVPAQASPTVAVQPPPSVPAQPPPRAAGGAAPKASTDLVFGSAH